jgi:hypothetical protein
MPSDKDHELEKISRSLHEARNLIRGMEGKAPEPYQRQEPEFPYCSFCGKGKSEVGMLVEGPSVFICDECVEKAQEIIRDSKSPPKTGTLSLTRPLTTYAASPASLFLLVIH